MHLVEVVREALLALVLQQLSDCLLALQLLLAFEVVLRAEHFPRSFRLLLCGGQIPSEAKRWLLAGAAVGCDGCYEGFRRAYAVGQANG